MKLSCLVYLVVGPGVGMFGVVAFGEREGGESRGRSLCWGKNMIGHTGSKAEGVH